MLGHAIQFPFFSENRTPNKPGDPLPPPSFKLLLPRLISFSAWTLPSVETVPVAALNSLKLKISKNGMFRTSARRHPYPHI